VQTFICKFVTEYISAFAIRCLLFVAAVYSCYRLCRCFLYMCHCVYVVGFDALVIVVCCLLLQLILVFDFAVASIHTCVIVFMLLSLFLYPIIFNMQDRREDSLQRQNALNTLPGATRTIANAVQWDTIEGRLRHIRNVTVRKIDHRLCQMGMYEKLNLNYYFVGLLCWQRYKAIQDMRLGLPSGCIQHWSWMPGGGRAGLAAHVIWKVPKLHDERDLQKIIQLQNQCVAKQTIYYNKATRNAFLAIAEPSYINRKSAVLTCVTYFTGEFNITIKTPIDKTSEGQRPQLAAEFALLTQDEDIALDLRTLNGRPKDPAFDPFWAKAKLLLEEYKKVDDRRHGALLLFLFLLLMVMLLDVFLLLMLLMIHVVTGIGIYRHANIHILFALLCRS